MKTTLERLFPFELPRGKWWHESGRFSSYGPSERVGLWVRGIYSARTGEQIATEFRRVR